MILDNVNPNDLFPTEKKGPSVLGMNCTQSSRQLNN